MNCRECGKFMTKQAVTEDQLTPEIYQWWSCKCGYELPQVIWDRSMPWNKPDYDSSKQTENSLKDGGTQVKNEKWFYPLPHKSKHEICLNHGDPVCQECHEEWCKYSQDGLTQQIMRDDAARQNKSIKGE